MATVYGPQSHGGASYGSTSSNLLGRASGITALYVAERHSTVFGGCTAIPLATALWQITDITDTPGKG